MRPCGGDARRRRHRLATALGCMAAIGLLVLYAIHDPAQSRWTPKCLFHVATGMECPGCGSQRALHALLHGRLTEAWGHNALMMASLPVLALMAAASALRRRRPRLYALVNSVPVIVVCAIAIAAWFIIRNFLL